MESQLAEPVCRGLRGALCSGPNGLLIALLMGISISAAFDSGNIEVVDTPGKGHVRLRIRVDAGGEFFQWFHFRASGVRGQAIRLDIIGPVSYTHLDVYKRQFLANDTWSAHDRAMRSVYREEDALHSIAVLSQTLPALLQ